jgi:hypothetical protein
MAGKRRFRAFVRRSVHRAWRPRLLPPETETIDQALSSIATRVAGSGTLMMVKFFTCTGR